MIGACAFTLLRQGEQFEQGGPGPAEQPGQRGRVISAGGLPQLSDPAGRVDQRRLGGLGHGGQVRPDERAGHEDEPGPAQTPPLVTPGVDNHGPAGPADVRVQVGQHLLEAIIGQMFLATLVARLVAGFRWEDRAAVRRAGQQAVPAAVEGSRVGGPVPGSGPGDSDSGAPLPRPGS